MKMNKIISAAAMLAAISFSGQASAACCNLSAVVVAVNQTTAAVKAGAASIVGAIGASTTAIVTSVNQVYVQAHRDAVVANDVNKEIAVGQTDAINTQNFEHEAMRRANNISDTMSSCASMNTGLKMADAIQNQVVETSALNKSYLQRSKYNTSTSALIDNRVATHNAKYCSAKDVQLGRCGHAAGDPAMEDADINPDSLFTPSGEVLTYTADQRAAAEAFATRVVAPYPVPNIPKSWEKTPEGKAYVDAVAVKTAQESLAMNSLNNAIAMRSRTNGLGGQLASNIGMKRLKGNPDASLMAIMEAKGTQFMDPEWHKEVIAKSVSPADLLKEQVRISAYKSFVDYKSYQQLERIEAILAADYAAHSTDLMEKRLAAARVAAEGSSARGGTN